MKNKVKILIFIIVLLIVVLGIAGTLYFSKIQDKTSEENDYTKEQSKTGISVLVKLVDDIRVEKLYDNEEYKEGILVYTKRDAKDNVIWTYKTEKGNLKEFETVECLEITEDKIYINELGIIKVISRNTGKIIWENSDFGGASSSFCFGKNENLYIASRKGPILHIIDSNGKTIKKIEKLDSEYDIEACDLMLENDEKDIQISNANGPDIILNLEDYSYIVRDEGYVTENEEGYYFLTYTKKDRNNNVIWKYKTEKGSTGMQCDTVAEITISNNIIYICENGTIVALNKDNGKIIWKNQGFEVIGSYHMDIDNNLYLSAGTSVMVIDKNGNIIATIQHELLSSLLGEGGSYYFISENELLLTGSFEEGIVKVNLEDYSITETIGIIEYNYENDTTTIQKTEGEDKVIWQYETNGSIISRDWLNIIKNEKIYINESNRIIALDIKTGKKVWENIEFGANSNFEENYALSCIDTNENLYLCDENAMNFCIIDKSGNTVKTIENLNVLFDEYSRVRSIELINNENKLVIKCDTFSVDTEKYFNLITIDLKNYNITYENIEE